LIGYSKVCDALSLSITILYVATVLHNEQHNVPLPVYERCQKGRNAVFISQREVSFVLKEMFYGFVCPRLAAMWNGVWLSEFSEFTSAVCSSKYSAVLKCPFSEAT
jgi:hypothetical protein